MPLAQRGMALDWSQEFDRPEKVARMSCPWSLHNLRLEPFLHWELINHALTCSLHLDCLELKFNSC
jgi:hypothetical protein